MQRVAVIDIGKTNVKLALVDTTRMAEVAVRKMPNTVIRTAPYPHFATEDHWDFILRALAELGPGIDAISITTHGATVVLTDAKGDLALPILDYEHDFDAADYDSHRPPFAETGSPRLGMGLNVGAQLFWQFRDFDTSRVAHILTYPQYWAMRLTGVAAVEATSLGCHTDLWEPGAGRFSALVDRMGWRALMPPLRRAGDVLGPILPEVAARTGLSPGTPVICGIHDSNASLYPHLSTHDGPFAVVSTGTWVVCMAVGAEARTLDPARDVLVNVDAHGRPVPSARFMGGREYEVIRRGRDLRATPEAVAAVLAREVMLLPAVEPGSGPFRGRTARWTAPPASDAEEAAALAFYLALMTAECLGMIGARGATVVEGPFAANPEYLSMLAAATGREVLTGDDNSTGTAMGAALLADPGRQIAMGTAVPPRPDLRAYARAWSRGA